jgi:hypothetical protein
MSWGYPQGSETHLLLSEETEGKVSLCKSRPSLLVSGSFVERGNQGRGWETDRSLRTARNTCHGDHVGG